MNSNIKNVILKLFIGIAVVMCIGMNCFPLINLNGAGGGSGTGDEKLFLINPIETLVTEGAGYYLQAESLTKALLYRVEMQSIKGIDYAEMRQVAANALDNITRARETYEKLVKAAEEYTYPPGFIDNLKDFDYPGFLLANGLDEIVFKKVEMYLSRGDIAGLLSNMYSRLQNIECNLISIKKELDTNTLPGLSLFWKVNESFAEASLLGSYSTRVFYAVQ